MFLARFPPFEGGLGGINTATIFQTLEFDETGDKAPILPLW
jgi:hypothetical protein